MSVKLGSISIAEIPLGGVQVAKAYLGDVLVFRNVAPYLEINPTYIWINPDDLVSNDVRSNTTWGIL